MYAVGRKSGFLMLVGAAGHSVCQLDCKDCPDEGWYSREGIECRERTAKIPRSYVMKSWCWHGSEVRDEETCFSAARGLGVMNYTDGQETIQALFTSLKGCIVEHSLDVNSSNPFTARICFGNPPLEILLACQVSAFVGGSLVALLMSYLLDHVPTDAGRFERGIGITMVTSSMTALQLFFVWVYRFSEIVMNLWIPMTFLWYVNPWNCIPAWLLVYAVPALYSHGIKPLKCPALFFIDEKESLLSIRRSRGYCFSFWCLVWPILRVSLLVVLSLTFWYVGVQLQDWGGALTNKISGVSRLIDIASSTWMNPETEFILSSQVGPGTALITFIKTVCSVLAPLSLLLKFMYFNACSWCALSASSVESLYTSVATQIKEAEEAISEDAKRNPLSNSGVQTMRSARVAKDLAFTCLAWGFHIYTALHLASCDRLMPSMIVSASMWEMLVFMWWRGYLQQACSAIEETWRTGIRTEGWLVLLEWDSATAAIPSLGIKLYALPLTATAGWTSNLLDALVLLIGTRSLVKHIIQLVDIPGVPYNALQLCSALDEFGDAKRKENWRVDDESSFGSSSS